MDKPIYCGHGKMITTKRGDIPKISFRKEDLDILMENLENGWVNVEMLAKKEPKNKMTHYLKIDTWKPQKQQDDGFGF